MKIKTMLLMVISLIIFVGCTSKENTVPKQINESGNHSSDSKDSLETEVSLEDLKGTPNGKVEPELDGKKIDSFESYDKLSEMDKEQVIISYLVKSLGSLVGDEKQIKEMLKNKGFNDDKESSLTYLFSEVRSSNSEYKFNDVMIKLVQKIMEKPN